MKKMGSPMKMLKMHEKKDKAEHMHIKEMIKHHDHMHKDHKKVSHHHGKMAEHHKMMAEKHKMALKPMSKTMGKAMSEKRGRGRPAKNNPY